MMRKVFSIVLVLCFGMSGCQKKVETATSGHRLILAADPYLVVLQHEADEFMSIYPDVKMEVRGASTREAIVLLLNDSVRSIVVDRPFNKEEQQVIQQSAVRIVENKIAEDGVAIIVHNQNPMKNIRSESLQAILTGAAKSWNDIKKGYGSDAIDFVVTGKNSGMYELLQKKIFSISKLMAPATVVAKQFDVVRYVAGHPWSIGCVAASFFSVDSSTADVKVLPVIWKSPEGVEKEYLPGQQEIYSSLYPFHYSLYLYNAEAKTSVGVGFGALILSNVGQKIIQRAGLVPAVIPYRTIQLHAE